MGLKFVTITGADDGTDPQALVDLSREFPFVEWGILLSHISEGWGRFPSRKWIKEMIHVEPGLAMNFSGHLCGEWVRDLLVGGASTGTSFRVVLIRSAAGSRSTPTPSPTRRP